MVSRDCSFSEPNAELLGPIATAHPERAPLLPPVGLLHAAAHVAGPTRGTDLHPLDAFRARLMGVGRLAAATGIALGLIAAPSARAGANDVALGPGKAPIVLVQPQDVMVAVGSTATFKVAGTDVKTYQWHQVAPASGDVLVPGGDSSTLTIQNAQPIHEGSYYCVLANDHGSVASIKATLDVISSNAVTRDSPAFEAKMKNGTVIRGYSSPLLERLQNDMVDSSPSFRAATMAIMAQDKTFVVMEGTLPGKMWGVTLPSRGVFYVVVDYVKARATNARPAEILAHELKHVLDASPDTDKFARDYNHENAEHTYGSNPFEISARSFGSKVIEEMAFSQRAQIAKTSALPN